MCTVRDILPLYSDYTTMDNRGESSSRITATFRFASGEVLGLDEDQIAKIPYITAMVSSDDRFKSARDEDGHYKLNPHINYRHFSYILKSLSFRSVRQLFIRLSIKNGIIPVIALFDFLGLESDPVPGFNEIDSTFFSTVVYSPLLERHIHLVRPANIRDMAVRFGIALSKEEYDLTNCEVLDRIYWFVMFILSTPKWFGTHLCHNIYKIAEHTFILFKPSLLKLLKKLKHKSDAEAEKLQSLANKLELDSGDEDNSSLTETSESDLDYRFHYRERRLEERENLLLHRIYQTKYDEDDEDDDWFWLPTKVRTDEDPMEPVYRRILEIMYEQLHYVIPQSITAESRQIIELVRFIREMTQNLSSLKTIFYDLTRLEDRIIYVSASLYEHKVLPKRIENIFKHELVQEEIRALTLEELCILTPQLERRHAELLDKMQKFKSNPEISRGNGNYMNIFLPSSSERFETIEREILSHELLLEKLHRDPNGVVEKIQQRVVDMLNRTALKQFFDWAYLTQCIDELGLLDDLCQELKKYPDVAFKTPRYQHQKIAHKPLLKRQFKHLTR